MKQNRYPRRTLALLLALMILMSMLIGTPALADDDNVEEKSAELIAAETLHKLGLFLGYGDDEDGSPVFGLEDGATRLHGIIMLLRYLGMYDEALKGEHDCPFVDVTGEYNRAIVGYAFAMGYTKGVSETKFDPTGALSATMYLTFILRALGYEDGVDFEWNAAWTLADELGITKGEFNAENNSLLRGQMVLISLFALQQPLKGSEQTLIESLTEAGVFDKLELDYDEIAALVDEAVTSLSEPDDDVKEPDVPLATESVDKPGSGSPSGGPTPTQPVYITGVTISGESAVGATLTAAPAASNTPNPIVAYQWQTSPDGVNGWLNIAGATFKTYMIKPSDEGQYIKVVATQTGASGSPFSSNVIPEPAPAIEKASIVDAYITGDTTVTVVLDQPAPVTCADFVIEVGVENVWTLLTGVAGTSPASGEFAIEGVSDEYVYIVLGSALEDGDEVLISAKSNSELLDYDGCYYDQRIINTSVISNTVMTRISYDYAEFRFESSIYGTLAYIVTAAGAPAPDAAQIDSIAQNEGNAGYTASVVDFGLFSIDDWYDNSLWLYLGDDAKIGDAFTFYFITTTSQGELSDVTAFNISAQQEIPFAYGLYAWSTLPERKIENVGKTVLSVEGAIENPASALIYISIAEQSAARKRVGEDISGALSSDYTLLTPSSLNVEYGIAYISTSPMKIEPGRHTIVQVDSQGKVIMAGTAGVWEYDTLTALILSDLDGKAVKSYSINSGWSAENLAAPIVNNGEAIFLPTTTVSPVSPGNLTLYTEEKGDPIVFDWGFSYYPPPTTGYAANIDCNELNWVNSVATAPPLVWYPIEPRVWQVRLAFVLSFESYFMIESSALVEKYEVTIVDLEGRVATVPTTKDMYDDKFSDGTAVPGGYVGKVWAFDIIDNDYVFSDPGATDAAHTYFIEDGIEEIHNSVIFLFPFYGLTVQWGGDLTIFVAVNFDIDGEPDGTVTVVTGVDNVNDYIKQNGKITAVSYNTGGIADNIANIVYIYDADAVSNAAQPVYITGVTISGESTVWARLTAELAVSKTPNPTVSYQWQISPDGVNNWSNITGATFATYVIQHGDEGKCIKVVATQTEAPGSPFSSNVIHVPIPASDPPLAFVLSFDYYVVLEGNYFIWKYEVTIVDLEGRVATVLTTKDMYDGKSADGTAVPGGYAGKVWAFDRIDNEYVFSDPGTQDAILTYIIEDRVEEVHNRDTYLYPNSGLTVQRANNSTIFVVANFDFDGKPDGTVNIVTGVNNVNDYIKQNGNFTAVSYKTDGNANNIANIVYICDADVVIDTYKLVYVRGSFFKDSDGYHVTVIVEGRIDVIVVADYEELEQYKGMLLDYVRVKSNGQFSIAPDVLGPDAFARLEVKNTDGIMLFNGSSDPLGDTIDNDTPVHIISVPGGDPERATVISYTATYFTNNYTFQNAWYYLDIGPYSDIVAVYIIRVT